MLPHIKYHIEEYYAYSEACNAYATCNDDGYYS